MERESETERAEKKKKSKRKQNKTEKSQNNNKTGGRKEGRSALQGRLEHINLQWTSVSSFPVIHHGGPGVPLRISKGALSSHLQAMDFRACG